MELLIRLMQDFHAKYPHLKVILEPGSAFAWQTGTLVASVIDIVTDHDIKTAILDVTLYCSTSFLLFPLFCGGDSIIPA